MIRVDRTKSKDCSENVAFSIQTDFSNNSKITKYLTALKSKGADFDFEESIDSEYRTSQFYIVGSRTAEFYINRLIKILN